MYRFRRTGIYKNYLWKTGRIAAEYLSRYYFLLRGSDLVDTLMTTDFHLIILGPQLHGCLPRSSGLYRFLILQLRHKSPSCQLAQSVLPPGYFQHILNGPSQVASYDCRC
ncbi:hypothetical protein PoB_002536100 [Plakobranchus ocellatus]|uniref:Uncharacterized protein n=1 Tax=Plakobranchus ocellatus TaxID=259542 RepID=A0AAV3ZIA7_9GAST|nr:hypothetical protein PoB_002536100 [Plakobranchus ocellatus]